MLRCYLEALCLLTSTRSDVLRHGGFDSQIRNEVQNMGKKPSIIEEPARQTQSFKRVTLVMSSDQDRDIELYTAAHGLKKKDVIARAISEFLGKRRVPSVNSEPTRGTRIQHGSPVFEP